MSARSVVERYPGLTFTGLCYLLTWVIWIPAVRLFLAQPEPTVTLPLLGLALLGSYGPTFAAFILTGLTRGRPGVMDLLRRYGRWRVGAGWIVLAFLAGAIVFGLAQLLGLASGRTLGAPAWEQLTLAAFAARVLFALPFGPLAEEAGWRGYLLPVLQRRHSALTSSLLIGVVWTFWHFPMFWVPGAALPPQVAPGPEAVALYLLGVGATSVIATTLYNSTGGSLFIAVLYHLSTNLWHQVLAPVFVGDPGQVWREQRALAIVANWMVALVLVLAFGWRRLSRREPVR